MTTNIHQNTPEITVLGQGGRALRQLRYCRRDLEEQVPEEHISRNLFNDLMQLQSSIDARFFAAGTPNFQHQSSLNGQVLRTDSVDAGISHTLYDIEGRPAWRQDARRTMQRYTYDELGRLTARYEDVEGAGTEAIRERFIYGEDASVTDATNKNLHGQPARHYDTAGLADQSEQGHALSGGMAAQTRRLLPIETASNWQSETEENWQDQLEANEYATHWQYSALGQVLNQTDAKGHAQDMAYDVQGRLKQSGITPSGKARTAVLVSQSYNAAGQKLHEEAGNGVATGYTYEPETQRLLRIHTSRTSNGAVLQDLHYFYDPVGHIISIHDDSAETKYFRNQKVNADRSYGYDSLYQLISATGRENASLSLTPDIDNPSDIVPIDSNNYTNYTRSYTYDPGGNLTKIQHQGEQNYTRNLKISANSNHAVRDTLIDPVENYFDAAGNQIKLDTGQDLAWNGLNQLQRVITIARKDSEDDQEVYQYDGDGMRIRKLQSVRTSQTIQTQEVIYLPGLELRRKSNDATITEDLEMLTIGAAGRSQARMLNWTKGNPADIPNRQLRYSLDDHLGSSQLELDQDANVLTREEYYPYGGTAVRTAKSATEVKYKVIRYSGKERDNSGLYYYGFRYYQPWLGRWTSCDPIGALGGLNLYAFVLGNPITNVDLGGMMPAPAGAAGGAPRKSSRLEKKEDDKLKSLGIKPGKDKIGRYYTGFDKSKKRKGFTTHSAIHQTIKKQVEEDLKKGIDLSKIPTHVKNAASNAHATHSGDPDFIDTTQDAKGRTVMAIGRISDKKHISAGAKSPPTPKGGIDTRIDDRGHLVPEAGVAPGASTKVNSTKNIVAEQIIINEHYKKSFEDAVKDYAANHPSEVVMTQHFPIYSSPDGYRGASYTDKDPDRTRPKRIQHYMVVDGVVRSAFTFKNSKRDIPDEIRTTGGWVKG